MKLREIGEPPTVAGATTTLFPCVQNPDAREVANAGSARAAQRTTSFESRIGSVYADLLFARLTTVLVCQNMLLHLAHAGGR